MKPLLSKVVTNLMVTIWLGPYKRFKVLLYSLARTLIALHNPSEGIETVRRSQSWVLYSSQGLKDRHLNTLFIVYF
jgi:hypothetical protein